MDWLSYLRKAKKSCMIDGNLKKVRYDFDDGKVMVEEYNTDTYVVTRRAWKSNSKIDSDDKWDVELGDPEPVYNQDDNLIIKENSSQPFITKRLTKRNIEWRIRNLPYKLEVYSVTADPDNRCITVRTSNKKYFKKLPVPDLDRINLVPVQKNICISHNLNTLIITYNKPPELLELEKAIVEDIKQVNPPNHGDNVGCNPS